MSAQVPEVIATCSRINVNMALEVDEASKSLVASWFSDESFDTEPEDIPSKSKKNKKKATEGKTVSPIVKEKISNGIKQSSPSKGSQSPKNISSVSSFLEEKLKKKLIKSKHIKDDENKEREKKFTGMKKKKMSTGDSSDDDEESKSALVAKKSPSQTPIQAHTVESLQQKLQDNTLSNTAKKKLKKKLHSLLSTEKKGSKSNGKQTERQNSETNVTKKNKERAEKGTTEPQLVNGTGYQGDIKSDIKSDIRVDNDRKKAKKQKKLKEKQKKQVQSDKTMESVEIEAPEPKKRQKEESSDDESDDVNQVVTKKQKVKISENSGTPDRSRHSIATLEQKLNVTTSKVARKNIRKKITELKARQQARSTLKSDSREMQSSYSSESGDTNVATETTINKSVTSPVKESLLDKLKKIKSPALEKAVNSAQTMTVISAKRSSEDAGIENDSPIKAKKKSKVQTEVGGATQSPEKSIEERLAHFNQRLQEEGLSLATKKRIRRQIKKLKSQSSGSEDATSLKKTKTKEAGKADSATKVIKTKDTETVVSRKKDSSLKGAKIKKADSLKMKDKKKTKKIMEEKLSDDKDMLKETEGWESDENLTDNSVLEEIPKKKKKVKEGHIRKRVKKRSKQKNIKKDNRPDHMKPPHLRMAVKECSDDSS